VVSPNGGSVTSSAPVKLGNGNVTNNNTEEGGSGGSAGGSGGGSGGAGGSGAGGSVGSSGGSGGAGVGGAIGKKNLQHPLASHVKTELQMIITKAILMNGEPCPFDKIYEFVSSRWKNSKYRRNAAAFANDSRRIIQAILRHTNGVALFKKDEQQSQGWRLCTSGEEVPRTIPSPETISRVRPLLVIIIPYVDVIE
jgi:hypothetical protein